MGKLNKFERNEWIGRQKHLKIWENPKLEKVERFIYTPMYEKVDCYQTGETGTYVFEIKNRGIFMEDYDDFILEKNKYNELMKVWECSGHKPIYETICGNGVLLWDLTQIRNYEERDMKCTATSAENYGENMVYKPCLMLLPSEARIIRFSDSFGKRLNELILNEELIYKCLNKYTEVIDNKINIKNNKD